MRPLCLVLALLGTACGPLANPGPGFTGHNNSSIIDGAEIGRGGTALFPLQKTVTVKARGAEELLSIVDGTLTRTQDSTETGYLVVRVKNISTRSQCFIQARDMQWKNPVGAVLTTQASSYLTGSVGQFSGSGLSSDTCLAPAETGVLADIQVSSGPSTAFFSPVSEIDLTWDVSNSSMFGDPPARLIPTAYQVASNGEVTVSIANQGTGPATVDTLSPLFMVVLSAGSPVGWFYGYDKLMPASGLVAASATANASSRPSTDALGSSLWTFVRFEVPCSTCLVARPNGTPDEVQRAQLRSWNEEQQQIQRQLER
jgi:hypothetical protein